MMLYYDFLRRSTGEGEEVSSGDQHEDESCVPGEAAEVASI